MKEFMNDLNYVNQQIDKSVTVHDINAVRRLKRGFFDKWCVKMSPTDPEWIKVQNNVNEKFFKKEQRISRAYLTPFK
jgi:hypothetical protein